MIQFIQPIWLFAIAGITIPVIIHLWNIREGKTLKIASISLLIQSSRQNARSLKLRDLFLLLLRCLLISLIAIILSEPRWQQSGAQNEKGWIVMEKQGIHETYTRFKPLIDSLSKAGFEFHYFEPGYSKVDLESVLKHAQDSISRATISYWKLSEALEQQVPSNLPVYLFTSNSLERFTGPRPRLSINVKWNTYTPSDSVANWLVDAYFTEGDSIRLITAESRPTGTFYKFKNLAGMEKVDAAYQVEVLEGKIFLETNDNGDNNLGTIEVDTSISRITIFEENFANDAAYLKAAIEAIQQFTARKISISIVSNEKNIPRGQDWLFWLSERAVPPATMANKMFVYEKGKQQSLLSWIRIKDALVSDEPALFKLIVPTDSQHVWESVIWQDGFGRPVLSLEEESQRSVFHFFSRFDPAWNDLPWSEEFPAMILNLLAVGKPFAAAPQGKEKRVVDNAQVMPREIKSNAVTTQIKPVKYSSLTNILWMTSFVIFFLERLISLTTKRKDIYG